MKHSAPFHNILDSPRARTVNYLSTLSLRPSEAYCKRCDPSPRRAKGITIRAYAAFADPPNTNSNALDFKVGRLVH